jgi:hypothetical protein
VRKPTEMETQGEGAAVAARLALAQLAGAADALFAQLEDALREARKVLG